MDGKIPADIDYKFSSNNLFFYVEKYTTNMVGYHHVHNYIQIWHAVKGKFRHVINGHEYIQEAGSLVFLPPYTPHIVDTHEEPFEAIYFDLADNVLDLFPDGIEKDTLFNLTCLRPLVYNSHKVDPFLRFSKETCDKITEKLNNLLDEFEDIINSSPTYIRANLVQIFALIAKEYSKDLPFKDEAIYAKYRDSLQRALEYINANFTQEIKLDDVCKIALMSRSSFSYVFPRVTGQNYVEYLNFLRIRLAKKMLKETKMAIRDVAVECGFTNPTHFGRVFKQVVGCTASEFVKWEKLRK